MYILYIGIYYGGFIAIVVLLIVYMEYVMLYYVY